MMSTPCRNRVIEAKSRHFGLVDWRSDAARSLEGQAVPGRSGGAEVGRFELGLAQARRDAVLAPLTKLDDPPVLPRLSPRGTHRTRLAVASGRFDRRVPCRSRRAPRPATRWIP